MDNNNNDDIHYHGSVLLKIVVCDNKVVFLGKMNFAVDTVYKR